VNALRLLTFGSTRQSAELSAAAAAAGYRMDVAHVREDVADWVPREASDILADARAALARWPTGPHAVVNLGRATVPDGIRRIAEVHQTLRAGGELPRATAVIGPSEPAARVWADKSLTARSLVELGMPIPATVDVSPETIDNLMGQVKDGELRLPLVVKLVHLTGGAGMRYVDDAAELPDVVATLAATGARLVASEFVAGDEVSVDVLRLGDRMLLYPPAFKRHTDPALTHADNKIKVMGLVRRVPEFERDIIAIAEHFDLQGFFSVEGVVTSVHPARWRILEGATRVTNNVQLQDGSLGFNSFAAVAHHLAGRPWLPPPRRTGLALSIPTYVHRGPASVEALADRPWVRQVKLEDLSQAPASTDDRLRLTVKLVAEDLPSQLDVLVAATGDAELPGRVNAEIDRVAKRYGR
jgi:hypothetical protein